MFMNWLSYKDIDDMVSKREAPYDDAHRQEIIEILIDNDYVICGDTHQSNSRHCIPLFEDGYIFLSMRSWGELMAKAQNKKEGVDKYKYLDFYMAATCPLNEKLP